MKNIAALVETIQDRVVKSVKRQSRAAGLCLVSSSSRESSAQLKSSVQIHAIKLAIKPQQT